MKKETVNENDLFYILDILENAGIRYYLDGGWGVDVLTGKQNREHRDVDIDFDAEFTDKLIKILVDLGYETVIDWLPIRLELWHKDYGYLDIHPFIFNADGSAKQANLENDFYHFDNDFFTIVQYKERQIPCISKKAQLLFHSGYEMRDIDLIDIKNLETLA